MTKLSRLLIVESWQRQKKKRKTWIKKREPMKNTADSLIDRTKNLWGPRKKRAKEKKMNKLHQ